MNSSTLKNFQESNNDIPYFGGYEEIGDFHLEKNQDDKKIIENAKVGYTVYGVENLEELKNTKKNIIVVIPALTGTSKIFDVEPSQGNGWANTYGSKGNILDPNENIVISLDYFGSEFNTHKNKHNLDFYPVPPEKQVEAWKKLLEKLGVKNIDMLFGGSNGGGHIHHWLIGECEKYEPKTLIPVAGPIAPTEEAKEFFRIQLDYLNGTDVSDRLEENLKKFKTGGLFDELIKKTKKEISESFDSKDNKKIMKVVRQIGFLKFLGPKFFDRFYFDKKGIELNKEGAIKNMMNYFEKEGKKFEKRFGKSYLKILLQGIVDAQRISPKEYVKKVSKKVDSIIIGIKGDTLFDSDAMEEYFLEVKRLRELRGDIGKTVFKIIESDIYGHDDFLQEDGAQKINNEIENEF